MSHMGMRRNMKPTKFWGLQSGQTVVVFMIVHGQSRPVCFEVWNLPGTCWTSDPGCPLDSVLIVRHQFSTTIVSQLSRCRQKRPGAEETERPGSRAPSQPSARPATPPRLSGNPNFFAKEVSKLGWMQSYDNCDKPCINWCGIYVHPQHWVTVDGRISAFDFSRPLTINDIVPFASNLRPLVLPDIPFPEQMTLCHVLHPPDPMARGPPAEAPRLRLAFEAEKVQALFGMGKRRFRSRRDFANFCRFIGSLYSILRIASNWLFVSIYLSPH